MKIYNTLSGRKEEFKPLEEGKVKMYVCGPTVYNLIHIGNARPMILFDTVRRYMEYKGYEVNYVSNFTDVDDKIIKKAMEEGVDASVISERYIAECKKDMEAMNVKPATVHPKATQEIGGMLEMIQKLIDKGYAYAPGYDAKVIMAAGAFVSGSSIELSADGPIRPPYAVYFQGGLTWPHAKAGILRALQSLADKGLADGILCRKNSK